MREIIIVICVTDNRISNFSKAPLIPSFLIIKVEKYPNIEIGIYLYWERL